MFTLIKSLADVGNSEGETEITVEVTEETQLQINKR
jgi:hypothetical protein